MERPMRENPPDLVAIRLRSKKSALSYSQSFGETSYKKSVSRLDLLLDFTTVIPCGSSHM